MPVVIGNALEFFEFLTLCWPFFAVVYRRGPSCPSSDPFGQLAGISRNVRGLGSSCDNRRSGPRQDGRSAGTQALPDFFLRADGVGLAGLCADALARNWRGQRPMLAALLRMLQGSPLRRSGADERIPSLLEWRRPNGAGFLPRSSFGPNMSVLIVHLRVGFWAFKHRS